MEIFDLLADNARVLNATCTSNFQSTRLEPWAIDGVVVTHSHIDHTHQVESLLTERYERTDTLERLHLTDRAREAKDPLDLFLSADTFHKLSPVIDAQNNKTVARGKVRVLTAGTTIDLRKKYGLKIQILEAKHYSREQERTKKADVSSWLAHAVSLIFHLFDDTRSEEPVARIGLTSDSRPMPEHAAAFRECDVLVGHLGTVSLHQLIALAHLKSFDRIAPELERWNNDVFRSTYERDIMRILLGMPALKQKRSVDNPPEQFLARPVAGNDGEEARRFADIFRGDISAVRTPRSGHLQYLGLSHLFHGAFQHGSRVRLGVISEFGLELGALRHKVSDSLNHALFGNEDGDGERRIITGDVGLVLKIAQPSECPRSDTCAPTCVPGSTAGLVSIRCTMCRRYFPPRCITDLCIRARDKAIFYNCPDCRRPEYSPDSPIVSYRHVAGTLDNGSTPLHN